MLTVSLSLAAVLVKAAQLALSILEKIELEGTIISMDTIADAVTQASANSGNSTYNIFLFLSGICWITGTIDAYRIGRQIDMEQHSR